MGPPEAVCASEPGLVVMPGIVGGCDGAGSEPGLVVGPGSGRVQLGWWQFAHHRASKSGSEEEGSALGW